MSSASRLHFVESIDGYYVYRYGSDLFEMYRHLNQWQCIQYGHTFNIEGDCLHEALYHVLQKLLET